MSINTGWGNNTAWISVVPSWECIISKFCLSLCQGKCVMWLKTTFYYPSYLDLFIYFTIFKKICPWFVHWFWSDGFPHTISWQLLILNWSSHVDPCVNWNNILNISCFFFQAQVKFIFVFNQFVFLLFNCKILFLFIFLWHPRAQFRLLISWRSCLNPCVVFRS